jgi:arylsulfatase A-like enzyme
LDVAGHTFSFCSTEYQSRVENINRILDDFFLYLKTLNLLEKVNIIITSDHGSDRNKMSHGKDKYDGNLMVPLFMMGPDFKSNYTITGVASGIDIAPTIINLYEMPGNDLWSGKVIYEALKRDINNNNAVEAVISVKANFIQIGFNSVKSLAVMLFLLVVVLLRGIILTNFLF